MHCLEFQYGNIWTLTLTPLAVNLKKRKGKYQSYNYEIRPGPALVENSRYSSPVLRSTNSISLTAVWHLGLRAWSVWATEKDSWTELETPQEFRKKNLLFDVRMIACLIGFTSLKVFETIINLNLRKLLVNSCKLLMFELRSQSNID